MWKPSPINNLDEITKSIQPDFSGFSIAPTFKCDSRCTFCHTWGKTGWALEEKPGDLNTEVNFDALCKVIKEANKTKTRDRLKCTVSGGESLLYSHFDDMMYFFKEQNIFTHVITNGSRLTHHTRSIIDCVEELTISLNGPPEIDSCIRELDGHFNNVCDGIEALLQKKIETKNPFPHIRINYVISKDTQDHIEAFVEALHRRFLSLGTSLFFDYEVAIENPQHFMENRQQSLINGIAILFEPLLFTDRTQGKLYEEQMKKHFGITPTSAWKGLIEENIDIDVPKLKSVLNKVWEPYNFDTSHFVDLETYFADVTSVFGRTHCLTPWHYVRIRPDGSVNFCSDLPDYTIGNINTQSFHEIWEGEKAEKFRDVMRTQLLPMCYRCDGLMCISEEHLGIKTVSL